MLKMYTCFHIPDVSTDFSSTPITDLGLHKVRLLCQEVKTIQWDNASLTCGPLECKGI